MPLQDHFHPPLYEQRDWHSFHSAWATFLASDLNHRLPEGYFAAPNVQFNIEIDVATFERASSGQPPSPVPSWTPSQPVLDLPLTVMTDIVEVQIFPETGRGRLAGAIEIVSPANKDRPSEREAFVGKCLTYLQQGVGLLMVDIVTTRKANLHHQLLNRLRPEPVDGGRGELYTASYHPLKRDGEAHVQVWQEPLTVGSPMPTMPLHLRGGFSVPVDLEATYDRTCRELRLTSNGT